MTAEADEATKRARREKKDVHWIVLDLFKMADEKVTDDKALEALILEKTGVRIPHNTLRYWRNQWSEPKISEVDLIARGLGYELELMVKEDKK